MQARYYDPVIGRFYSNDPVGYTAKNPVMSFNRYMYVNNNPYKYTDPTGEFLFIGAAVGAVVNLGTQLVSNGGDFSKVNYSEVAVSAAAGAIGVGVAGNIAKTAASLGLKGTSAVAANVGGNSIAGAGISANAKLTNTIVDSLQGDSNGELTLGELGDAALAGAVGGALGAVGGSKAEELVGKLSGKVLGESGTVTNMGQAIAQGGGDITSNVVATVTEKIVE